MDRRKILEAIQRVEVDTKYVLDDKKPTKGIFKVLFNWLLSYSFVSICSYFVDRYTLSSFLNDGLNIFYISRGLNILLFTFITLLYLFFVWKIDMTVKERDFLKTFSVYIIVFSLIRMLPSVMFYLNFEILLQFYDTVPLDILFIVLSLSSLYNYLKKKEILISIFINGLIFVLIIISIGIIRTSSAPSDFLLDLSTFLTFIKMNGILVIISFTPILLSLHLNKEVYAYG